MATYVNKIKNTTTKVTADNLPQFKQVTSSTASELEGDVQEAVIAFQF